MRRSTRLLFLEWHLLVLPYGPSCKEDVLVVANFDRMNGKATRLIAGIQCTIAGRVGHIPLPYINCHYLPLI